MGIGFEKLDRGVFDPEKAYDRVAELGVKCVRIQSGWQRTEIKKGVYDFELCEITVFRKPMFFRLKNIPIKDYPMAITFGGFEDME